MEAKVKKGLPGVVLLVLLLPLGQQLFSVVQSKELQGGFALAPDTVFTVRTWMDGSYQQKKERYLNDMTGFRSDLVRLNNQIDYSAFRKCHAGWTIWGRHNYLFQWPYINAYYGNEYVGYDTILEKVKKLKAIQDTMAKVGKTLIVVNAASKATFYPEYFPDEWLREKHTTNCEVYKRLGDSVGLNEVDMDQWFVSMKGKTPELLFSKQGIHWTVYGTMLAGDSLMNYVGRMRHIHVSHPEWLRVEHTEEPRSGDDDVARELNLMWPIAKETYGYPVLGPARDTPGVKPNMVYIGDSYGFKMAQVSNIRYMNSQCEMWCYFKEVVDINSGAYHEMKDYDWHAAMNKAHCIVLIYTNFNYYQLGNGFIEAAYAYYFPEAKK